jgi:DNA-binding beta-propeller fold protein YncE
MKAIKIPALLLVLSFSPLLFSEVSITKGPDITKKGDKATISFTVSEKADVEVAVLDSKGKVVRHLAAGVVGSTKAAPPLKPGLSQTIDWDGKNDFKEKAEDGPFKVRVRAGTGVKFGIFIGAEPNNFGAVEGVAADEDGNIYMIGSRGASNQMAMNLRVFDSNGKYLREVIPFPANLEPGAMKEVARWDPDLKAFRPRNLRNLNPDFYGQPGGYWANPALTLVAASKKYGIVLSDSNKLCILEPSGAVRGSKFAGRKLGRLPNSGGGPVRMAISPDGKWLYLSGPFSSKTRYGHVFNDAYPPGRIYRTPLNSNEKFTEFVTIPVAHENGQGGAWRKACSNLGHFTTSKGPVAGISVDAKGNVYVANREQGCVSVFDESGEQIGKVDIKNPWLLAVHPQKGTIYVTQFDCLGYHRFSCNLYKFENFKQGAKPAAEYKFPSDKGLNRNQAMALAPGKDRTVLWMSGVKGGLVPLEDKGTSFEPLKIDFKTRGEVAPDCGTNRIWRYNGKTGEGKLLRKNGKTFYCTDLSVGYDGLLYVRTGKGYSGGFARFTHDLEPAPFSGIDSHVLSPYIYSRMGNGFAERGLGVGPDGKAYLSFMYKWVAYAMGGFGPDGKPLPGNYLKGIYPSEKENKKYASGMKEAGAITSTIPPENGGIRVDLNGNIYLGVLHRPKGFTPPKGFEKDRGYRVSVGSVIKMSPAGCSIKSVKGATTREIDGALEVYTGLAPFSSSREAFGSNTCCVCRVPRFDLDRYGRVYMPNAMTNSVLVYDNAGNKIMEFGKYGNFDSLYINENTELGKQKKPTVAVPDIPMAWPTGAAVTEECIYVNDTYNRRALRVDKTYVVEKIVSVN